MKTLNGINLVRMARWILALRSGKYAQGNGSLCKKYVDDKKPHYCCLGVACDISDLGQWSDQADTYWDYVVNGNSEGAYLPQPVARWLGVSDFDPAVTLDGQLASEANDQLGLSFKKIATGLEKLYLDGRKAADVVAEADAEANGFLVLAEEHDADRTASRFLCISLECAEGALAAVPESVRLAMKARINLDPSVAENGVAYNTDDFMSDEEEREGRVMACLLFAQQAADEGPVTA